VPSDCFTSCGFPSGPTKVVKVIVLQLLQCMFVLLKKWSESLLFSYCSELYVINLYFIVIKYLLLWDSVFSCRRLKLGHPVPPGEHCEHDNATSGG
jgi:hypothetical protein